MEAEKGEVDNSNYCFNCSVCNRNMENQRPCDDD